MFWMHRTRKLNPNIHFEVFIHKVDGDLFISDFHKFNCQSDIQEMINREFEDAGADELCESLSYYLTSIYDHSIYEALSKVVQKLVPQHGAMENLLNLLLTACDIEKAFLFDVVSKLYIATDHNAVDVQTYQLCSDMLDLVMDVSSIYGDSSASLQQQQQDTASSSSSNLNPKSGSLESADSSSTGHYSPQKTTSLAQRTSDVSIGSIGSDARVQKSNFDKESASIIRLSNKMVLYLRSVSDLLAIVCLVRESQLDKRALIDHNINLLRSSLKEMFTVPLFP
jgi:Ras-related GTP-binding protein C/D